MLSQFINTIMLSRARGPDAIHSCQHRLSCSPSKPHFNFPTMQGSNDLKDQMDSTC